MSMVHQHIRWLCPELLVDHRLCDDPVIAQVSLKNVIEVQSKDQFWSRFKHPFNDDPKTVGVMINVSSVAGRPSPILFIVECWAASFRPPEIYRTVIDPHTAPAQFYRAVGRDIQQTGRQECYFVPVENFTQIS